MTARIVTPAARKIAVTVTPYFFKNLFYSLKKRHGSFSCLNLSSQPGKLLLSFCNSFLGSHSLRRRSVIIVNNRSVFLILALKLSFVFLKVIEGFCAVEPFLESIFSLSFSEISVLSLSTVAHCFAVFFACFSRAATSFLHCKYLFQDFFSVAAVYAVLIQFQDLNHVQLEAHQSLLAFGRVAFLLLLNFDGFLLFFFSLS